MSEVNGEEVAADGESVVRSKGKVLLVCLALLVPMDYHGLRISGDKPIGAEYSSFLLHKKENRKSCSVNALISDPPNRRAPIPPYNSFHISGMGDDVQAVKSEHFLRVLL
jgi:hypothetical protein